MPKLKPEDELRNDWINVFNRIPNMQHERVENIARNGTADYAYCLNGVNGWIEFKVHYGKLPGRCSHWTGPQRKWMRDRGESNTVFLMLRVQGYDVLLDTTCANIFEKYGIENQEDSNYPVKYRSEEVKSLNINLNCLEEELLGLC
tara:strand:+ start:366 stop:803 length:438 start_codon:yes stop_codon:yes gene_type:complete